MNPFGNVKRGFHLGDRHLPRVASAVAEYENIPLGHFGRLASLALVTWSVILVGLILVLVE